MKYWVYQDNEVVGPFDRDQIRNMKGFDESTLLCPDGRNGTESGDWKRANTLSEFADLLPSARNVATLPGKADAQLAEAVAEIKKKLADFEGSLAKLAHLNQEREEDISRLRAELVSMGSREQSAEGRGLPDQAAQLRSQVASKDVPREDKEARARIGELEAKIASLEKIEGELKSLHQKIDSLSSTPPSPGFGGEAFAPPPSAPAEIVPPISSVLVAPLEEEPPKVHEFKMDPPPPANTALAAFVQRGGDTLPLSAIERAPAPEPISLEMPAPTPIPTPIDLHMNLSSSRFTETDTQPIIPIQPPPAAPLSFASAGGGVEDLKRGPAVLERLAPEPIAPMPGEGGAWGKRKKTLIFIAAVGFALLMVLIVYFGGAPTEKPAKEAATTEPVTLPVASHSAEPSEGNAKPPVEEPPSIYAKTEGSSLADLSQLAVDLVKGYVLPGGRIKIEDKLKADYPKAYPENGELSPWMVERLSDGKYQVSFYQGSRPLFVFFVDPKANTVQGSNPGSVSLLAGEVAQEPPPAVVRKKKRRRKSARAPSRSAVKRSGETAIYPASEQRPAKKDASNASLDELLGSQSKPGEGK